MTPASLLRSVRDGLRAPRARADGDQLRRILVRGGYMPAVTYVLSGTPARLVFRREETAACSERVVFPGLGISVALPPFRDTTVELPASPPGTLPFTCEMEMLHGCVIVEPRDRELARPDLASRRRSSSPASA